MYVFIVNSIQIIKQIKIIGRLEMYDCYCDKIRTTEMQFNRKNCFGILNFAYISGQSFTSLMVDLN